MANRDLNNNRTFTNVVAPAPDTLVPALAEIGQNIIKQSQEAKIVENMSAAQLELGKLSNDFQIQYEGDPFNEQGLKDFKSQRQGILDKYGSGISPFFGRQWKDSAFKIASQNDAQVNAWGYKQAASNAKTSLINTAQNNLNQTAIDGERFARGEVDISEVLMNVHSSMDTLREHGNANLGSESTDAIIHDLGQDHIKTFISSVAKENPVAALRLMDNEGVQAEITNRDEFAKFREAIETKAMNFQDVAKQTEILNVLKSDNKILASGKTLSYAEIQQASGSMSEPAREYFMKINGYSKEDGDGGAVGLDGLPIKGKLKQDQKLQYKAAIYDSMTQLSGQEDISPDDIQKLQGQIYNGMRYGALTQDEGASYLTQLIDPAITQKEEELSQFSTGQWNPFKSNAGFKELESFFNEKVEIKPAEGEDKVGEISAGINATNKANLYDNYWNSLQRQAAKNNVPVADIGKLPNRDEIYAKAQKEAEQLSMARSSPVLKVQPSIPMVAIKKLLNNPEKASDFDAMFGVGAANRVLGK